MHNGMGLPLTNSYEYDNGQLTKETIGYGSWRTDFIEYTYDHDNLIRVEKFEQYPPGTRVRYATDEYFYDDSGRLIKEIKTNSHVPFDPPIFKYVITYEYRF